MPSENPSNPPSNPSPAGTQRRALMAAILVFASGLAILVATLVFIVMPERQAGQAGTVGGPFTLVDMNGRTVSDRDFAGAPFLVFFGYTHCPDVCPTTLYQFSQVLGALGPGAERVRVLFVSVDPARDTPAALKEYLANFDPRIIGLTGSPAQIEAMAKAYRVYFRKAPTKDGDYAMDHSSIVYLMDARGRFVSSFNLERPPADAAAELRRYL